MKINRRTQLILLVLIYVVVIVPSAFTSSIAIAEEIDDYTKLVPVENVLFDQVYLTIVGPLIMVVLVLLFTVPLARLFYHFHKIIKGKRYEYYIIEDLGEDINLLTIFVRGLTISLLSFSLAMAFISFVPYEIIQPGQLSVVETMYPYVSMLALFMVPFIILVFLPIWLLKDSGIICSFSKINKEKRDTPDIESVSRFFSKTVNGYTGIGTILTMVILMVDTIQNLQWEYGEGGDIPSIILTPILLAFLAFPALAIYESLLNKMKTSLIKKLENKGIKKITSIKEIL